MSNQDSAVEAMARIMAVADQSPFPHKYEQVARALLSTGPVAELVKGVNESMLLIDDLLQIHAEDMCDEARVMEAKTRFAERGGSLAYIADVQSQNRAALAPFLKEKGTAHEVKDQEPGDFSP